MLCILVLYISAHYHCHFGKFLGLEYQNLLQSLPFQVKMWNKCKRILIDLLLHWEQLVAVLEWVWACYQRVNIEIRNTDLIIIIRNPYLQYTGI